MLGTIRLIEEGEAHVSHRAGSSQTFDQSRAAESRESGQGRLAAGKLIQYPPEGREFSRSVHVTF
jgi:hypothetical protein